jgi:PAS domain-containing protein
MERQAICRTISVIDGVSGEKAKNPFVARLAIRTVSPDWGSKQAWSQVPKRRGIVPRAVGFIGGHRTMKADCCFEPSEAHNSLFFSDSPGGDSVSSQGSARDAAVAASITRKVWLEFLAQHDVAAAIFTIGPLSSNSRRHAFLVGMDQLRGNPAATQSVLSFAESVWRRMDCAQAAQFDLTDLIAGYDHNDVVDFVTGLPRSLATRAQCNGSEVRALYLRRSHLQAFTDNEIASLRLVLPLFAESAAGEAQMEQQSQRTAMLEAMFNRVSLSMAMLDADAQPLFMNNATRTLLDERKWLIRMADGSIGSKNAAQSKELRKWIRLTASSEDDVSMQRALRLDDGEGEWRLAYVTSAKARPGTHSARCALLMVLAPGRIEAPTQLLEALGLLPSEQRFLGHFLKSSSLNNAAVDCGLSEETARTYLKRVRAKLGVHRQMELAGLISGLVLPLDAGGGQPIGE